MNKEAIELVKKVKSDLWDYTSPNVNVKNEKLSEDIELLDQALAILRTEQLRFTDMERRLKAHSAGEAVKDFCRACRKPFWNVDDESMICPHCGSKEMPVPDIDAEQIA